MSNIALIGYKIGMTSVFQNNINIPVTVVSVPNNYLLEIKKYKKKSSLLIGASEERKLKKINKPQLKVFEKSSSTPCNIQKEFPLKDLSTFDNLDKNLLTLSQEFIGNYVDIQSISQGKGFQGGMKRHGFKGLRATHGVSVSHRSIGSTGNRTEPGKVFKNKKMPGHMGNTLNTIQNLKILDIDLENNLIFVKGSFSGAKGSLVFLKNSIKKSFEADQKMLNFRNIELKI